MNEVQEAAFVAQEMLPQGHYQGRLTTGVAQHLARHLPRVHLPPTLVVDVHLAGDGHDGGASVGVLARALARKPRLQAIQWVQPMTVNTLQAFCMPIQQQQQGQHPVGGDNQSMTRTDAESAVNVYPTRTSGWWKSGQLAVLHLAIDDPMVDTMTTTTARECCTILAQIVSQELVVTVGSSCCDDVVLAILQGLQRGFEMHGSSTNSTKPCIIRNNRHREGAVEAESNKGSPCHHHPALTLSMPFHNAARFGRWAQRLKGLMGRNGGHALTPVKPRDIVSTDLSVLPTFSCCGCGYLQTLKIRGGVWGPSAWPALSTLLSSSGTLQRLELLNITTDTRFVDPCTRQRLSKALEVSALQELRLLDWQTVITDDDGGNEDEPTRQRRRRLDADNRSRKKDGSLTLVETILDSLVGRVQGGLQALAIKTPAPPHFPGVVDPDDEALWALHMALAARLPYMHSLRALETRWHVHTSALLWPAIQQNTSLLWIDSGKAVGRMLDPVLRRNRLLHATQRYCRRTEHAAAAAEPDLEDVLDFANHHALLDAKDDFVGPTSAYVLIRETLPQNICAWMA